ncbi:alpha/beta fold hydrolase [Lignipirellula cremea]|uniref:3-oxoadipate enol-lactonase 2 n=1 Tax=Lignipirellula cremea TaxID=2528010 RepID=A0A518DUV8_9BACT|nr:alpha/beta fold hydrolase [Lignipirellula cremea]QDU95619.1 3-oxoadipate enol-lactonase 2 [Lignipirellula cremea]
MKKVALADTALHLHDEGTGPVLLLVHGFPLDHSMWREQIAAFRHSHRVLAPDLRGFGQNEAAEGTVTMEQFADDLAGLLDALGITEKITFCGLSMGGYIAWQFWQRHSERLERLILCDTRAAADGDAMRDQRAKTADRARKHGMEAMARVMAQNLFAKANVENRPALVEEIRAVIAGSAPSSVAAALHGMAAREEMTSRLPGISKPTLVLCGEHDEITPAAEMKKFAQQMPHAEYRQIPDAGHLSPLENPNAVNAAMQAFLV